MPRAATSRGVGVRDAPFGGCLAPDVLSCARARKAPGQGWPQMGKSGHGKDGKLRGFNCPQSLGGPSPGHLQEPGAGRAGTGACGPGLRLRLPPPT